MTKWQRNLAFFLVGLIIALGILAPFLSPYLPESQNRAFGYTPPMPIRLLDEKGHFSRHPFTYSYKPIPGTTDFRKTDQKLFLTWFVEGDRYEVLGFGFTTHLFGLEDPSGRIFLLGSDSLGRDLFSRTLYGVRFSLAIGISAILLTMAIGVVLGALSGYIGGWFDSVMMRVCDVFLSLPGLFLILGIRAVFPLEMSPRTTFWLIVGIFGILGWGAVTRVVRGQVLSLKERPHVLAAKAIGASHTRILLRHILPLTTNYLLVQASVFLPLFILGEITLSFLGVGIQEPGVSLGTLLTSAASVQAVSQFQWLTAPVIVIFLIAFAFNLLAEEIKSDSGLRTRWW